MHLQELRTDLPAVNKPRNSVTQDRFFWDRLPFAGIAIGVGTGILGRVFDSWHSLGKCNFSEKYQDVCGAAFPGSAFFRKINGLKQWEIKNCAFLTPLLPIVIQTAIDAMKDKSGKNIFARIKAAVKKNFSREQGIYLATIAVLSLKGIRHCRAFGMCSPGKFDPSGHIMMKVALAQVLSKGIASLVDPAARTWKRLFDSLYAVTDAVFIHHTVRYCHTLGETIAGLCWGLGVISIAELASKNLFTDTLQGDSAVGGQAGSKAVENRRSQNRLCLPQYYPLCDRRFSTL